MTSRRAAKSHRHHQNAETLRSAVTDFSIYDYSHTTKGTSVKTLTQLGRTLMDDQDWYEKDLTDFDDAPKENSVVPHTVTRSKHKSYSPPTSDYLGRAYPLDVWYLIARYLAPEDVGRFALICRATNSVVNSVAFWITLFRNYDLTQAKRTCRLLTREHVSIVRPYVIKSLYQTYPTFRNRMNKTDAIQKDPHYLLSSRCIRIWYSKLATQLELYNYYFEFCFDQDQSSTSSKKPAQASSTMFQNENEHMMERNSTILHVVSSQYVPIGPYMGMLLSKITLNISSDYRYHKLKMWFATSRLPSQKPEFNDSVVVIDPVRCLRVYKWFSCPPKLD